MAARYVAIYLNDHLAGSTIGVELARRAAQENAGSDLGAFLSTELLPELCDDRNTLREVMARLSVPESRVKLAAAWAAEKIARLKLNGETTSYSPLSRLLELEGLAAGINAKKALWLALRDVQDADGPLAAFDLDALTARAESQLERLEAHRAAAATAALS
jgi:hypothetical protein